MKGSIYLDEDGSIYLSGIGGPPQPDHTTVVSIELQDYTPIDKPGKTDTENNKGIYSRKKQYTIMF